MRPTEVVSEADRLAGTWLGQMRKDWRTSARSFVRGPGGDEERHREVSRHGLIELSLEGIGLFSSHHFDAGC
jgi:hypothetical protein